jgi:transcriptional regulator of acetoin/glycerol metabolism
MAGTVREQSRRATETGVRLLAKVLCCDRLLDPPTPPWAWHADKLVIGRGDKSGLAAGRLTLEDKRVSSEHASLELRGDTVFVTDLGSSNGTFVDGERIKAPTALAQGALLEVGRTLLTWRETKASLAGQIVQGGVTFGNLCTFSPAYADVLLIAARAAPTQEPLLVVGETGTGKDLLARALHEKSGRKGPFVAVDAGAIPDTLFE